MDERKRQHATAKRLQYRLRGGNEREQRRQRREANALAANALSVPTEKPTGRPSMRPSVLTEKLTRRPSMQPGMLIVKQMPQLLMKSSKKLKLKREPKKRHNLVRITKTIFG